MFSALGLNSTLHILDVRNGVKYYNAPIETVSPIRPMYPTYTPGAANGLNMGSVVDIAVTLEGKRKEFTNVSAIGNVSTSDLYIIADNKEAIISQVDNILLNSTNAVSQETLDKHNNNIKDCKEILKKLNPTFAKEAAMDSAIATLTERVNTMQNEFGDIKGDVGLILNILTNSENRK